MGDPRRLAVAVATLACVFGCIVPSASAKAKPDLVVKSLADLPASVEPGGNFTVTVTTQNKGKGKAKASVTRFALSSDGLPSGDDVVLGGQAVKKLKGKAKSKDDVELAVPNDAAEGGYELLACADADSDVAEAKEDNNCKTAGSQLVVGALTSKELIDAAVKSGEITEEEGLTYKVFAEVFDPRLPERFASNEPDPIPDSVFIDVQNGWDGLSAGAKETLGPFLVPPFQEGSYLDPSVPRARGYASHRGDDAPWCGEGSGVLEDWSFVEADAGAAAGKIRIWYQDRYAGPDLPTANSLMTTMETKIWPNLTTLMAREPLPDHGSTSGCQGGSDAIDIALVDRGTASVQPSTGVRENTSGHMLFPRTASQAGWTGLEPYLAHEFMHLIQLTYTLSDGDMFSDQNKWLREGTAQWVQDYVSSPTYGIGITPNQTEHQPLPNFFGNPAVSLDNPEPFPHHYASYVFSLWSARSSNNPQIIRDFWNGVGTMKTLEAAQAAYGSGWKQAWKDFVRTNWNQGSINQYQTWDQITNTPALAGDAEVPLGPPVAVTSQVDKVAAKYVRFSPGQNVQSMTYRKFGADLSEDAGVQAIVKYKNGTDESFDLTEEQTHIFPTCNVEHITIVLSNSSVVEGNKAAFSFNWETSAIRPKRGGPTCEPRPLGGTFSGDANLVTSNTTIEYHWSGNVDFEKFSALNGPPPYQNEIWDLYHVTGGTVNLSGEGTTTTGCTIDFPEETYELGQDGSIVEDTMRIGPGDAENLPHYQIDMSFPNEAEQQPVATVVCPGEDPKQVQYPAVGLKLVYTGTDVEQSQTLGTYTGTDHFESQDADYTWSFADAP